MEKAEKLRNKLIIDVREKDEYEAEHVPHSIHIPLSHFATSAPGVLNQLKDREIILLCRSGARAKMASEQIKQLGYEDLQCSVYDGGILNWKAQGNPVLGKQKFHLPLLRQVQIGAGLFILIGMALGTWVHPGFYGIAAFVGAGLTFAGATGFCLLANILHLMPWNRFHPKEEEELCATSPSNRQCQPK